jgi:hypothetical protein
MLDIGHERNVIEDSWELVEREVRLPVGEADFLAVKGPAPRHVHTKRRFHRFYFRGKAILYHQDSMLGAYSKDVSREGIGLLSPVQLFPKVRVQLRVTGNQLLNLEIARCRRVGENCYECGAKFVVAPQEPC